MKRFLIIALGWTMLAPLAGVGMSLAADCMDDQSRPEDPTDFEANDDFHYRILMPNGGESYCIGQTMKLHIFSEDYDQYGFGTSDVALEITVDGGTTWFALPQNNMPELSPGTLEWVIPDSIGDGVTTISMESNQVFIRIVNYLEPDYDFDITDAPFSIKAGDGSSAIRPDSEIRSRTSTGGSIFDLLGKRMPPDGASAPLRTVSP